jgi:protein TonB
VTLAAAMPAQEQRRWGIAIGIALAAHLFCTLAVLGWQRAAHVTPPDPIMVVELPAEAPPPSSAPLSPVTPSVVTPVTPLSPTTLPTVPPVKTPLPADAVTQPTQSKPAASPSSAAPAAQNPPTAASKPDTAGTSPGTSATPGTDPKAKKQEADYFALLSAHLNRKKSYPAEAKKARQQGVVAVRFTIGRTGAVSNVSIKRSSGHEILDTATLDLLRRISPLPAFPASMKQASATVVIPIEYSLRTS